LLNRINALAIENSPDGLLAVRGDVSCVTPVHARWRCSASRSAEAGITRWTRSRPNWRDCRSN